MREDVIGRANVEDTPELDRYYAELGRQESYAPAHNHASSALRFVMEGKGAYTVVDGHKMDLSAGDFVITPSGTWHDHGVEPDGAVTVWQDGLDMLLVNQLAANFYAVHPDHAQKSNYPLNDTAAVYGGPGLLPAGGEAWGKADPPPLQTD